MLLLPNEVAVALASVEAAIVEAAVADVAAVDVIHDAVNVEDVASTFEVMAVVVQYKFPYE